jgi:glycosyltransferase involved in cell wall biosynthesis
MSDFPGPELRILYVGLLPPHPGGAPISCTELLTGLADAGARVRALAPVTPETGARAETFARRYPGLAIDRFLVPRFDIGPHQPAAGAYRRLERARIRAALPRLIEEERPHLLLIGRETFVWDAPDLARAAGLPSILMARGGLTLAILNGSYPQDLAEQVLAQYRKADLIVTPARHLTRGLRRLGLSGVRTIPNALDLRRFAPGPRDEGLLARLNLSREDIVVLHASNLKPMKRARDLIVSAALTLPRAPRLAYLIVGDGQEREVLEATARELGISARVRFAGWVDYAQMPDYIRLADLVVMPSEFEGQSRVYLEAQACGRVLLASDVPGAREVIADGQTGLLFRTGDVADLAAKTLRVAEDAELRRSLGNGARASVHPHDLSRAVADYQGAITRLLHRPRGVVRTRLAPGQAATR